MKTRLLALLFTLCALSGGISGCAYSEGYRGYRIRAAIPIPGRYGDWFFKRPYYEHRPYFR